MLLIEKSENLQQNEKSKDSMILSTAINIHDKIPKLFDLEHVKKLYPSSYSQSMNVILTQELLKFNSIIELITSSIKILIEGLRGNIMLSEDFDEIGYSIYSN